MQRTRCGCWPLTCTDRSHRPKRPALTSRFCITLQEILRVFGELDFAGTAGADKTVVGASSSQSGPGLVVDAFLR